MARYLTKLLFKAWLYSTLLSLAVNFVAYSTVEGNDARQAYGIIFALSIMGCILNIVLMLPAYFNMQANVNKYAVASYSSFIALPLLAFISIAILSLSEGTVDLILLTSPFAASTILQLYSCYKFREQY